MDWVEAVQRFFASYPMWARALAGGGIAVGVLTLLVVPRTDKTGNDGDARRSSPPGGSDLATPAVASPAAPPGTSDPGRPLDSSGAPSGPQRPTGKTPIVTQTRLIIEGVELFPPSSRDVVQVIAYVNDVPYTYPSVGGVEWLFVGSTMSPGAFRLPSSVSSFDVRFEMRARQGGEDGPEMRYVSQRVVSIDSVPFEGTYELHRVPGARSATVDAEVRYRIQ